MGGGRASWTKDPCGEIHFTGCFRRVEGTEIAAGIFLIVIGRHWGLEWGFRTMVWWMATQLLGGFSDFRCLRDTFLPMLVNKPAEYPEPDEDKASNQVFLDEPESNKSDLPHASPPQKAVVFCPLAGQVRHLKWWLAKIFGHHLDIIYMYAEMGNDERTEMQLKFQDLPDSSLFVTTPKVGGTGLNLTATNHPVITQKFWVLNEQHEAFVRVVRLQQNRVPHTWLLNTGPNGCGSRVSDLHQLSGVAQMRLLHGMMCRPNIMLAMIYKILKCRQDHKNQFREHGDLVLSDGEDEQ